MPRREIAPGRSCFECRRRKIKCDRSHPCSYCVKTRIKCRYPAGRSVLDEEQTALDRVASLEARLFAVERRLTEIDKPGPSPSLTSPSVHEPDDAEQPERRGHLTQGQMEELHSISPVGLAPSSIVNPQPPVDLDQFRPSRPTIALLWQRYLEVVDPLLKVFHTPTVQKLVMKAVRGRDALDLASECFLFVIFYAAVVTMSREDSLKEFEEERYRTACENLLSRLKLLESLDMVVLQAFTVYLIVGRCDDEGADVYARVGLAIGMALKMGLNKDGEVAGLPPFQIEMRRRLWWQLCILDIRVAEDRQSEPCILESSFNTRLPMNVADANLHSKMKRPAIAESGRTEMLYSLVRFEGSYFARQLVFSKEFAGQNGYMSMSMSQRLHAIDLFQERIEKQYLMHCDEQVPFDRVTIGSIRLVLAKLRLMVQGQTPEEQTPNISAWVKLLQDAENLRKYGPGRQWLWLFQTYIEWDALVNLLTHFRAQPFGDLQTWEVACRIYRHWKDTQHTSHDYRWKRIEKLRGEVLISRGQCASDQDITA
ncbi:fungal-specific transcription factor domain-containing protein [Aspergillus carlsbadensis]|nr:fungal-specific transcription factor domain-containing protein [Aspergillus carlsbadensis]